MSTKFYPPINRGGQLIFVTTLLFAMMPIFIFGQVDDYTIYGESLWRNQGYGVKNHSFQIENYVISEMQSWYVNPDPITDDCPTEFYTTDEMPLSYPNVSDPLNTLKIWPYSVNNASDYRNGVSTLDLYAIQAHLLDSPSFKDRTPTEDFPYRFISGDADMDEDVDEDDIDMIQDLILFYRDDLTRNSWEWVYKDEVENAEERFEDEPYGFVISQNWPYPEGIILPELSTNEIMADNDKYFTFRSTKIGDITGSSSQLITSLNSWVCGSGSYFTGGNIETRTSDITTPFKVNAGSIVTVGINLGNMDEVFAYEVPLYFSESDFEMTGIKFGEGFNPKWNRNEEKGSLVLLDFSRIGEPLNFPRGRVIEIQLKAQRNVPSLSQAIYWHTDRNVEIIGHNEISLIPDVNIEVIDFQPAELSAEIRAENSDTELMIESPFNQSIRLSIINYQGQVVYDDSFNVLRGQNLTLLPNNLLPGFYLCRVKGKQQESVIKWISR